MGHDLLHVPGARLDMEAGDLDADQQGRSPAGHGEVADRAETGKGGVTAHVSDQQALQQRGEAPLRGKVGQKDTGDLPLFDTGAQKQGSLFSRRDPAAEAVVLNAIRQAGFSLATLAGVIWAAAE